MRPVYQTKFGGPNDPPGEQGDCWVACIASITGIGLHEFPESPSMEWNEYWDAVISFLKMKGFGVLRCPTKGNSSWISEWPGHLIASGKSPNGDWDHCVIYRKGQLVHDPHPKNRGLIGGPHEYEAIVLL